MAQATVKERLGADDTGRQADNRGRHGHEGRSCAAADSMANAVFHHPADAGIVLALLPMAPAAICLREAAFRQRAVGRRAGVGEVRIRHTDVRKRQTDLSERQADVRERHAVASERFADVRERHTDTRERFADFSERYTDVSERFADV